MNGNPNAILLSEMKAWLDLFPEHDINMYIRLISAMDSSYISYIVEKGNKDKEKT